MWRSCGRDGSDDGAVVWVLDDGGAVLCLVALLWFRGKRKGEHWRVRERVGVSGNEARGSQISATSAWHRGPGVSQRQPHSGHALSMVGHDRARRGGD